ncbi:unnamed protein product [Dibothriocephalus latus]|uniref:Globin domain-containing protein n=1 Tax=Dibothriocephalus latus TaxID=60516 RepID=A0A3P6SQR2_DIBLA|nr:unnamed protein product [Dibothriocephalus latus]
MSDLCQSWVSKRYLHGKGIVCALPEQQRTRKMVSLSGAFQSSPTDTPTTGSNKSSYALDISGLRPRHSSDRGSLAEAPPSYHTSIVNRVFSRRRTIDDLNRIVLQKIPISDYFSEFEKDVLLSTWAVLSEEADRHATAVFNLACQMFPGLRNIFGISCENDDQDCCESEVGKRHRDAYMNMINDAIECLEYPREDFYDDLLVAGAHYATIPGMKTEYFKVIKRATLVTWNALLGEEFTEDVKQSWQSLLDYIITVISEGCRIYEQEEERALLDASPQLSETLLRALRARPSVVSMTEEEWKLFHSLCR